jgi:hypothetical protein
MEFKKIITFRCTFVRNKAFYTYPTDTVDTFLKIPSKGSNVRAHSKYRASILTGGGCTVPTVLSVQLPVVHRRLKNPTLDMFLALLSSPCVEI